MKIRKISIIALIAVLVFASSVMFTGCSDEEKTEETTTEAVTEETTTETASVEYDYENIAGEYQDKTSQRATATLISDPEVGNVKITVMWSNSASEATMWEMTAEINESKLVYKDCKRVEMTFAEGSDAASDPEETVVYENGEGYFEISDEGTLKWTGAADEECQDCVFEPLVEEAE